MNKILQRDYSILGSERQKAIEKGLVSAEWYQCPVPRKRMKELMARRNGPALRDIILWVTLLVATGYIAFLTWGTWWAIPAFAIYGAIYSISSVSRWHEFSHGTPFRTGWPNEVVYQLCAILILEQASYFRWSHARHHTDTLIVGSDPEIMEPRPPMLRRLLRNFLRESRFHELVAKLIRQSFGKLNAMELELIPSSQRGKLFWEARLFILIYGGLIALCFYLESILPLMFVGLPAFYGSYMNTLLVSTQHMGLYEDMLDHRICARTFYTNPFLRFLYSNMNYHMEHHMFPMVPFYSLPALHAEIKGDCPAAAPSFPAAVCETFAALWRERTDPTYIVPRYRAFAEMKAREQIINQQTASHGGAHHVSI
jgi:fatty acid desaturase